MHLTGGGPFLNEPFYIYGGLLPFTVYLCFIAEFGGYWIRLGENETSSAANGRQKINELNTREDS